MQTVQALKKELEVNLEFTDFLEALRGVAASEYKILEKRQERFGTFLNSFQQFFGMIDFSQMNHPLATDKGRLAIMIITSNEGFMGGLNTRVINKALDIKGQENAKIIVIGEKGASYFRSLGYNFEAFPGVNNEKRYEESLKWKDYIIKGGLAGEFSRLTIIYPKPVSFTVQKTQVLNVLPCTEIFKQRSNLPKEVITEGTREKIVEYLLDIWITEKLFEVIEDSNLAEFAARIVHLEESNQALKKDAKLIKEKYFRSYHETVDKGIRELFAARILHRKKKDERG